MFVADNLKSSLIKELEYDEDNDILYIKFQERYYISELVYEGVDFDTFMAFLKSKSLGSYYLRIIKQSFKLKKPEVMANEKPKTINQSSDEFRWIDITINVRNIKKDWIFAGEKGDWLHMSMRMQPDGEIDAYGNLGMITQKVPKKIYEAEIKLPKEKKTRGPILGNACEFAKGEKEGSVGSEQGEMGGAVADDLPF